METVPEIAADPLPDLRAHAERVAAEVRTALERLVLELAGASPRPADLITRTRIDKSLAGRIIQLIRTADPLTLLQRSPAPSGLRIFLRAAAAVGARPEAVGSAEESVRALEALLDRFPTGRAGLEAAISGWLPEARNQGEKSARQSVHRAMSFLLGHQVDASIWAVIVQPSADGRSVDAAHIRGKFGLRRLRVGDPLAVFTVRNFPVMAPGIPQPQVQTLDGRISTDPGAYILPEFCSADAPSLDVIEGRGEQQFVLPADQPTLNVPVTLVLGEIVRNCWQRYASPALAEEWQTTLPRIPSRVTFCDTFIRDDLYPGVEPIVTSNLVGVSAPHPLRRSSMALDEVKISVEHGWMPGGVSGLATGEIPRYPELMAHAFNRLGWDPSRFRVHRLRLNYPVPGIAVTRWYPLPPPPAGA